jgi:hypothetical protein
VEREKITHFREIDDVNAAKDRLVFEQWVENAK